MAYFQNCVFSGGQFTVRRRCRFPDQLSLGKGSVSLADDDYVAYWYLYNNLFRGGSLSYTINHVSDSTTGIAYDNVFDRTAICGSGIFANGYNGYVTNCNTTLQSQGNDVILTNSPVYQTSYLGNYYYPTNDGMLSTLIDAGSRWATNAGLYHFTTTTNQVKEGSTKVDIGFHYVALGTNSLPLDTTAMAFPITWPMATGTA